MKKIVPIGARLRKLFPDDETHFVELVRHFFRQFFENEFISRGSEARLTVIHVLALLAVPPIFYTFYLIQSYDYIWWNFPWQFPAASLVDQCRYVTFSMVVLGFVAVLEWEALFLDRRDYAILTPLPLKARTIFAAKITALVGFLSLFIVDVGGVPTLLYPLVETMGIRGRHVSFLEFCDMVAAHALGVLGGSAFIFLFFVAVQGVLINLLPPRLFKKISLGAQVLAMSALLLLLFLMPIFSTLVPAWQRTQSAGLFWLPPLWFVGLYRTILGSGDPVFHSLAKIAVLSLGVTTLASAAGYMVNYKRHAQRALESSEAQPVQASRLARAAFGVLNRLVLRRPLERATFYFVLITLVRSTKHRLYLATYVGVGFALATFGILEVLAQTGRRDFSAFLFEPQEALLAIPLIMSFFLLSGMRMVFAVPADLGANWVFQLAEDENRQDAWRATRKAMVVPLCLLFLALFPLYAVLWGWPAAFQHIVCGLALSLILVEALLTNFRKIPFTCSYQPGKANLTLLGVFYWLAFTIYAYTMASLERWVLQDGVRWIIFLALLLVVLGALVVRRKAASLDGLALVYEDEPNPEVQTLGLGG